MNLKGYIKLVIMALAIMFLSVENCFAGPWYQGDTNYPSIPSTQVLYYSVYHPSNYTLWGSYYSYPFCDNGCGANHGDVLGMESSYIGGVQEVHIDGYYPDYKVISADNALTWFNTTPGLIGYNATWDQDEYEKGDIASISITLNSSTFNTGLYDYEYVVISPSNEYVHDGLLYSASNTFSLTLSEVGTYTGQMYITNKTYNEMGIELDDDYHVVSDGTTISFITFNRPSYTLGDTATISFGISSSFWDNFGFRYIEIYKDGIKIKEINSLPYFGTRQYKFDSIGEYEAQLWSFGIVDGYEKQSTSSSVWVEFNPSYLIINTSIPIKTTVLVNYSLGETDSTTDLINVIEAYYLNPLDNSYELEYSCYFDNRNTTGTCPTNVDRVGTYMFYLKNLRLKLVLDSAIVYSYYVDNKPQHNYTTNSINVTKDQWYQGDYISGNYQIKASQFNSSEIYLNYYSVTDDYHYSFSETLLTDTGTFNNFIPGLRTGHNIVYLNYTNSTISGNLAQKPFNVSSITSTGYGLTLSSYEVGLDEIFNIYVTIPPYPSKGKLRVVEQTYNEEVYNVTLNNSMTIPQSSGIAGTYSFILSDSNNEVQVMRLLVVKEKTDNITTTTTTAGEAYGLGEDKTNTGMVTNLIILIGMPIFWGLAFLLSAIYYLRNNSALILPVLFILINVEAVVGLLEPYTTYIVIMTWLIISMNYIFVQKKITG